jgi:HEPN domain-containing protein
LKTNEDNPEDWLRSARSRLASADRLFAEEGATEAAIELLQEATERLLKAYLIARGWPLRKVHDLGTLVAEAEKLDSRFAQFADFADELTDQFWAVHYPGGEIDDPSPDYARLRDELGRMLAVMEF